MFITQKASLLFKTAERRGMDRLAPLSHLINFVFLASFSDFFFSFLFFHLRLTPKMHINDVNLNSQRKGET